MKVSELLRELRELEGQGLGDLTVRVSADHAQVSIALSSIDSESYIEKDDWMTDTVHIEDVKDYPDAIRVVELGGY